MNSNWITAGIVSGVGLLGLGVYALTSVAYSIEFEYLGYQVQFIDSEGVTFQLRYAVTNPTGKTIEVWNQYYEVYVSGYNISKVSANERYKLPANNSSVVSVNMRLNWKDIQDKIAPMYSQSSITDLGSLPVLIKGTLSAKMMGISLSRIPVRTLMHVSDFLP